MSAATPLDVSIVIVSFNTRDLLRECLQSIDALRGPVAVETFVVDNQSRDGSAEMVEAEFPHVRVLRAGGNLGFAAANNLAFPHCTARHVVLLNSDAFLTEGALALAVSHMDADPGIGLAGARLVGRDGSWQPSARLFPSHLNEFLLLTGLAARFPNSRFFGRCDRTWADQTEPADVDWVPGAFSIIRRDVLEQVGYFDESFFLYYEEVDLCRRIVRAGFRVRYLPDVSIIHVGGESAKKVEGGKVAKEGTQLALWRMRSALLYYRKHHGIVGAAIARWLDQGWHAMRAFKNRFEGERAREKADDMRQVAAMMARAWRETQGGAVSPPRPW